MSDFTPPLRKIVRREGDNEFLECGHEQKTRPNKAKRRRCTQCRRASVTVTQKTEAAEGSRCPYCFDDFSDPEEETWSCPKCRAKLHGECHDENDGCTTLGCRSRAPVSVRPRITPTQIPQAPQPVAAEQNGYERDLEILNSPPEPARTLDMILAATLFLAFGILPFWIGCDHGFWSGLGTAIIIYWTSTFVARQRGWPRSK